MHAMQTEDLRGLPRVVLGFESRFFLTPVARLVALSISTTIGLGMAVGIRSARVDERTASVCFATVSPQGSR